MSEQRPSPDKLLQRAQKEEREGQHGKLKIYLGAAPGVGKTFAMLQDALTKRSQGLDVVIGTAESHGRAEIARLVKELEILPKQTLDYRGQKLVEFDLDAALKRNPGLILMDEMAHTNAPGLRHTKRWQDIKELLDRGIDVYTTLNVQHIESLNNVVSQIIHTPIKETVPDSMLEMANTIELVDLPPEDLLKRLQEGKVYFPQQAELAAEHFFRKGNLIALRELALRVTAERVGAEVLLYRQGQGIKHVWPTREKILVCVGASNESLKLIRAGRRLATKLQAEWIVVHVDTPRLQISDESQNRSIQNLRLAKQLGAETHILTGFDKVKEVTTYAREQNITLIVVGKRIRPKWHDMLFGSMADELVRRSGEIDVHIVTADIVSAKPSTVSPPIKRNIPWQTYWIALSIVMLATGIDFFLAPILRPSNLIMVYLLGITIVALFGRIGPSILASILSVLAYDFFFVQPIYELGSKDIPTAFTLGVMLLVSYLISHLTILTKRQAEAAHLAEKRTATLNLLSRQLASTRGVDKLLVTSVTCIGQVFDSEVIALLPENNTLVARAGYPSDHQLSAKEQGVAQWVYDLGQVAGIGTDTLPFSDALYLPLRASQETIGVLRIHPFTHPLRLLTPEQMHLLEGCANQTALAIEVDRIQEQVKTSEFQTEIDRARNALLQSVSHDLRTPLVAVMGAASTLIEMSDALDAQKIKKLGSEIYIELEQLSRLLNNMLQITYLEAEEVKLLKEYQSLLDVIHLSLKIGSEKLKNKPVHIQLAPDISLIPFDQTLLQAVFTNLIDNAIKFTPPESPIDISAVIKQDHVVVSIADQGPGIMPDEVNRLFEKFYRGRMLTTERGLGLGLAICRSVIKAHGGEIWAENRPGGGAVFRFTLPLRPSE